MFPHSYAWLRSLFLDKTHLCETSNIFYLVKYDFSQKTGDVIWKFIKNKGYLTVNTFPNYAYASSYFDLKSFAWK